MAATAVHSESGEPAPSVRQSDLPLLVDFWASWCGPCRMLSPILEELADEYSGRLRIVQVNTEEDREPALRHGVRGLPTLVFFDRGVEIDRLVGVLPKPLLKLWIERTLRRGRRAS